MSQVQLVGQQCGQYEGEPDSSCLRGSQTQKALWRGVREGRKNLKRLRGGPGLPAGTDLFLGTGNHVGLGDSGASHVSGIYQIWNSGEHSSAVERMLSIHKLLGSLLSGFESQVPSKDYVKGMIASLCYYWETVELLGGGA